MTCRNNCETCSCHDIYMQKHSTSELKQKVTEANAGEGSMRLLMEKSQEEAEALRKKYNEDTVELKQKIEDMSADLKERDERIESESSHSV